MNSQPDFFTSHFFTDNRQRLRKAADVFPIVVSAHGAMQRNADTTFPFRQDSNFWYLTGLTVANAVLVLEETDEYLIIPDLDTAQEAFNGAFDVTAIRHKSGIQTVEPAAAGYARLRQTVRQRGAAAACFASPVFNQWHGMYANPARRQLITKLKRMQPGLNLTDIRPILAGMRVIKQPVEQKAIQRAVDITCDAIDRVRQAAVLQSFVYEYDIELALTAHFKHSGSSGHAWTPIVANGKNAATIHAESREGELKPNALTVIDVGAEVALYTADISRTVCASPLSPRQAAVVSAVQEVQQYALSLLKPGTELRTYEKQVEQAMGKQLKQLKLITDATDSGQIRRYYPHAASHFLGLDVHDVGDYRTPLQPGMILTCEPGIYIPEEAIGVRLEDDVLIGQNGHTVMSAACSREAYQL